MSTELTVASITMLLTLFSFYLGVRSEVRKSMHKFIENKLDDEKKQNHVDKRICLLEERFNFIENQLSYRLNEISGKVSSYTKIMLDHIKQVHT